MDSYLTDLLYRMFDREELTEELHTDGLGGGQVPSLSREELFAERGFLVLPGLHTTGQSFAVKDEPFTVDDYYASGIGGYDFDYNFDLSGDDKGDAIVGAVGGASVKVIWNEGMCGPLDTGQPLLHVFKKFGHDKCHRDVVALGG